MREESSYSWYLKTSNASTEKEELVIRGSRQKEELLKGFDVLHKKSKGTGLGGGISKQH